MQVLIEVNKSAFNPVYYDMLRCRKRFIMLKGGRGSGKSVGAFQKAVHDTCQPWKHRTMVVRKTFRSHRYSTFEEITDIIRQYQMEALFEELPTGKSTLDIQCKNGNDIIFLGLDKPDKLKSTKGVTQIVVEELSELTPTEFTKLNMLLRGKHAPGAFYQIIGMFNPEPEAQWIKERFWDNEDPEKMHLISTTHEDNKFLDDEYRQELENLKEINYDLYKIYTLGKWGKLTGLIYPDIEVVADVPSKGERVFGIDFGYEHPTVITENRIVENHLYIKTRLFARHMTNQDLIDFINREFSPSEKQEFWAADSAEPARIEDLYREGLNIRGAIKDVKDGIDHMKTYKLHITDDSPEAIRQFKHYARQKDKEGNYLDLPVKMNDDAPDSARYGVYTYHREYGNNDDMSAMMTGGERIFGRMM